MATRRTVTIVFCDVVGSTALGERLDPEALREVMNRHHEHLAGIVRLHDGTVEKFVGDAVLAVFGIPLLREDDALRAVRAADEMRAAGSELQVRVGVSTGEVVTGVGQTLGSGDTFNVAARLEQAAAPGSVLIGEATFALVRDAVEVESLEPLALKGRAEPVTAYRLVAVTGVDGAERRLDAAIVGRERERRFLREAFERAVAERTCHLVTLLGDPGIGKSRLLRDAFDALERDATVLFARCSPHGEAVALAPVIDILGQSGGGPEFEGRDLAETFALVREHLEGIARERPTLVVLDDIHWAEPALLDLVDHLADWSDGVPLMVLCAARPELLDVRPAWGGGKLNATSLRLTPLGEVECAGLIDELVGGLEIDEAVRSRVAEVAEGNPLFAEQLVAMLQEGGSEVPPTIAALLAARLDALPPEERELLETASIAGREFPLAGVAHILGEPAETVRLRLQGPVRRRLLRTLASGEFRFHHDLVRNAAYRSVPKRRRADLHAAFADWLEQAGWDAPRVIGHHLAEACGYREELGLDDDVTAVIAARAAEALGEAGARALAIGDAAAALILLERAEALSREPSPTLLTDLGIATRGAGNLDEAARWLEQAQEAALEHDDALLRWRARVEWLAVASSVGRMPEEAAVAAVREAVEALEVMGDDLGLARAVQLLAEYTPEFEPALYERALVHARAASARREESEILVDIGWRNVFGRTPIDEAHTTISRMLATTDLSRRAESGLTACLAGAHRRRGELDAARDANNRALRGYRELGRGSGVVGRVMASASIEFHAGDVGAAVRLLREALEVTEEIGDRQAQGGILGFQSEFECARGRFAEALRLSEQAAVFGEDICWLAPRARALIALGDLEGALAAAERARSLVVLRGGGYSYEEDGITLVARGRALHALGRTVEGTAEIARGLEVYEAKGDRVEIERTRALLEGISSGSIGTGTDAAR